MRIRAVAMRSQRSVVPLFYLAPLSMTWFARAFIATGLLLLVACGQAPQPYDVAINNGRLIDPESRLDAVRSVGIRAGKIAAISETPLKAENVVDARGLVVSPGFINLHSHSVATAGYQLELLDGVTTVLELEAGSFSISRFGQQLGDAPLTHFGASVGHAWIRMQVVDPEALKALAVTGKIDMSGTAFTQTATAAQRQQMERMLEAELDAGGLGIGFLLDYMTRAVDVAERDMIFAVAARQNVPVFVHVRRGIDGDPAGLLEVIAAAERLGAAVHIAVWRSGSMRLMPRGRAVSMSRRKCFPGPRARPPSPQTCFPATGARFLPSTTPTCSGPRRVNG